MAKYFCITAGLRGCYADGETPRYYRAATRRELKQALTYEAESWRDAGYIGASKRRIATIAAEAWREAHKSRPTHLLHCLPLAPSHDRGNYAVGVFIGHSDRAEFRAAQMED